MRYAHIDDKFEQYMYASVDPFIQLTAAIALLVTALLGIVGYMVQNKASIAANVTSTRSSRRQRSGSFVLVNSTVLFIFGAVFAACLGFWHLGQYHYA